MAVGICIRTLQIGKSQSLKFILDFPEFLQKAAKKKSDSATRLDYEDCCNLADGILRTILEGISL